MAANKNEPPRRDAKGGPIEEPTLPPRIEDPAAPRVTGVGATTPAPAGERSLGDLFSELSQGLTALLRGEVALAKAEMSQKLSRAAKDAVFLIVGGVLAFGGYLALIATLIIVLTFLGVPLWLSALIVTVVLFIAGYAFVQKGLSDLKKVNPVPEKTIESVKEDAQWAKEQLK